MITYIYVLFDPRRYRPRYVGKTVNLRKRFRSHVCERRRSRKGSWICDLREAGLEPIMAIAEEVPSGQSWEEAEERWIADMRALYPDLLNVMEGGIGGTPGIHLTEETRAKLRLAWKNRSPQERERLREARRVARLGWRHSEATKAKMSAASLRQSAESRERGRLKRTGVKRSAEANEHNRRAHLGKHLSPEHRAKLHVAMLGKQNSLGHRPGPETRKKLSAAHLGKRPTPETRERLHQAQLLRWAKKRHDQAKAEGRTLFDDLD